MIGILGSGFGLYGYLPAVASMDQNQILLPVRYNERFSNRLELKKFTNQICWVESDDDLIRKATTIIISRRPKDQFQILDKLLNQSQIKNIIFEKPFAECPEQAIKMQQSIQGSDKKCSVGFIFRHLPWAVMQKNQLNHQKSFKKKCELEWKFMAHHYQNDIHNWKRIHSQGGGVIRFYGIHLISLLAEWGYHKVSCSEVFIRPQQDDYSKWTAIFSGLALPDFRVQIDSYNSNSFFYIKNDLEDNFSYKGKNPFGNEQLVRSNNLIDPRYDYLKKILIENNFQKEVWPKRLSQAIQLWKEVEDCTNFIYK